MSTSTEFTFVSGVIEYRYEGDISKSESPEEIEAKCFFTREFKSLPDLIKLVSSEEINRLRESNGYKSVWVESIRLLAEGPEKNAKIETLLLNEGIFLELSKKES